MGPGLVVVVVAAAAGAVATGVGDGGARHPTSLEVLVGGAARLVLVGGRSLCCRRSKALPKTQNLRCCSKKEKNGKWFFWEDSTTKREATSLLRWLWLCVKIELGFSIDPS